MAQSQALQSQEKKELVSKDETTVPVRYFVPTTDIFETEDALTVVMEVPGVNKEAVDISVENDVLKIEAKIDPSKPTFSGFRVVVRPCSFLRAS
jgi:HSP20 family protein